MVRVLPSLGQVRRYAGEEADKPATAAGASEFYALDTGNEYVFFGDQWVQKKTLAYQLSEMQASLEIQSKLLLRIASALETMLELQA